MPGYILLYQSTPDFVTHVANRPPLFFHPPAFHVRPFHLRNWYMFPDNPTIETEVYTVGNPSRSSYFISHRSLRLLSVLSLIARPTCAIDMYNCNDYPRATVSALLRWRERERLLFPRAFDRPESVV
jgi:hypothetical protein